MHYRVHLRAKRQAPIVTTLKTYDLGYQLGSGQPAPSHVEDYIYHQKEENFS